MFIEAQQTLLVFFEQFGIEQAGDEIGEIRLVGGLGLAEAVEECQALRGLADDLARQMGGFRL